MKPYTIHNFLQALNPNVFWDDMEKINNLLRMRYNEPQRAYHNWKHIEEGWKELDAIRPYFQDPCEAEFAWFFHDFVYIPGNPNNEKESADAAIQYCKELELGEEFQKKIFDLIVGSLDPKTFDQELFHDIDYSILGQKFPRYCEYVNGIKKEYGNFPISERIKFLENTLKKNIFYTEIFQKKYEKKARSNIETEISSFK